MKMIRVIKSYKKPMENDPFGFINLYHADIFDDDERIYLDEELINEAVEFGTLTEEQADLIKQNLEDNYTDGWFLNDNFDEKTLKSLKKFLNK